MGNILLLRRVRTERLMILLTHSSDVISLLEQLSDSQEFCEFIEAYDESHFGGYLTTSYNCIPPYEIKGRKNGTEWQLNVNGQVVILPTLTDADQAEAALLPLLPDDDKERQVIE